MKVPLRLKNEFTQCTPSLLSPYHSLTHSHSLTHYHRLHFSPPLLTDSSISSSFLHSFLLCHFLLFRSLLCLSVSLSLCVSPSCFISRTALSGHSGQPSTHTLKHSHTLSLCCLSVYFLLLWHIVPPSFAFAFFLSFPVFAFGFSFSFPVYNQAISVTIEPQQTNLLRVCLFSLFTPDVGRMIISQ